jgi:hypothetical protein
MGCLSMFWAGLASCRAVSDQPTNPLQDGNKTGFSTYLVSSLLSILFFFTLSAIFMQWCTTSSVVHYFAKLLHVARGNKNIISVALSFSSFLIHMLLVTLSN